MCYHTDNFEPFKQIHLNEKQFRRQSLRVYLCVCCACCRPPPSPQLLHYSDLIQLPNRQRSSLSIKLIRFMHIVFYWLLWKNFKLQNRLIFFRIEALSTAGAHQSGCVYRAHACAHTTMLAHSKKHIKENKTPLKRLHSPNELCPIEEQIEYEKHLIASN